MKKVKTLAFLTSFLILLIVPVLVTPVAAHGDIIFVPRDYSTIQDAIDAANDGDTILVGPGEWYGGVVNKPVTLIGQNAVIVDGVAYPFILGMEPTERHIGFFITPEGSGSRISHFTFKGGRIGETNNYLYFAIFARYDTNHVTLTRNRIYDCGQCITTRGSSNWVIKHNVLKGYSESNGLFFGIFFGSTYTDYPSKDNIISYNDITADVPGWGGYTPFGIAMNTKEYGEVSNNQIEYNKIRVTGPDTSGIQIYIDWLSEEPTPEEIILAQSLIHDNIISHNDLRRSTVPFSINPTELEEVNTISRNLL